MANSYGIGNKMAMDWMRKLLAEYESVHGKVDVALGSGLPWKVEVALVALGKKPVAMTHFDSAEGQFEEEIFLIAPMAGVMMSNEFDTETQFSTLRGLAASLGREVEFCGDLLVGGIYWFRRRNAAIVAGGRLLLNGIQKQLHFTKTTPDERRLLVLKLHCMHGYLFGYSEDAIVNYCRQEDPGGREVRTALAEIHGAIEDAVMKLFSSQS